MYTISNSDIPRTGDPCARLLMPEYTGHWVACLARGMNRSMLRSLIDSASVAAC